MKRFWTRWTAGSDSGDGLSEDGAARRYETRPTRPQSQIAVRVALWGAVALGATGGVAALLGLTGGRTETVLAAPDEPPPSLLPAPVASTAERAVDAWLGGAGEEVLESLFVEPPVSAPQSEDFEVAWLTTLAGGEWEEGYWLVTVAVEVHECVALGPNDEAAPPARGRFVVDCEPSDDDGEPSGDRDEGTEVRMPHASTWYVEVGVVGEPELHLAALATPAVVDAPAEVPDSWQSAGRGTEAPAATDPVAATVEDFLRGWLAGGSDLSRYLAPGVEVAPMEPALFTELDLVGVAYQELDPGRVRALAQTHVTTLGGARFPVAYEVELTFRDDRWEVAAHWGAPTLASRPSVASPDDAQG